MANRQYRIDPAGLVSAKGHHGPLAALGPARGDSQNDRLWNAHRQVPRDYRNAASARIAAIIGLILAADIAALVSAWVVQSWILKFSRIF